MLAIWVNSIASTWALLKFDFSFLFLKELEFLFFQIVRRSKDKISCQRRLLSKGWLASLFQVEFQFEGRNWRYPTLSLDTYQGWGSKGRLSRGNGRRCERCLFPGGYSQSSLEGCLIPCQKGQAWWRVCYVEHATRKILFQGKKKAFQIQEKELGLAWFVLLWF